MTATSERQLCQSVNWGPSATSASHSVTFAGARTVYQNYLKVSDAAAAQGDQTSALSVVTSAQWAQTKSQYAALAVAGTPVPRYRYGTPTFYVPALSGYPQWFVVAVNRTTVTGGKLDGAELVERDDRVARGNFAAAICAGGVGGSGGVGDA